MPQYTITDPTTKKTITLSGDSPPTEAELTDIFAKINGPQFQRVTFPQGPQQTITEDIKPDWKMRLGQSLEPLAAPRTLEEMGHLLLAGGLVKAPAGAIQALKEAAGGAMSAVGRGVEATGTTLAKPARYVGAWELMTHPMKGAAVIATPPVLQAVGKVLQKIGGWASGSAELALSDAERALLVKRGYSSSVVARIEAAAAKPVSPTPTTAVSQPLVDEAGRSLGGTTSPPPTPRPAGPWDANAAASPAVTQRDAGLREVFPEGTTPPTRGPAAQPPAPAVAAPTQPFAGPPLAQMWQATEQLGVKLNAFDMQAGAKLVAKGANPADVVQQFLKLRGLLKTSSFAQMPSNADVAAAVAARNAR